MTLSHTGTANCLTTKIKITVMLVVTESFDLIVIFYYVMNFTEVLGLRLEVLGLSP